MHYFLIRMCETFFWCTARKHSAPESLKEQATECRVQPASGMLRAARDAVHAVSSLVYYEGTLAEVVGNLGTHAGLTFLVLPKRRTTSAVLM